MVSRRRVLGVVSAVMVALAGCSSPSRERGDETPERGPADEGRPRRGHPAYSDMEEPRVDRGVQKEPDDIRNVMDFGAAGDGVTDDTQAIQAAIDAADAGDTVLIPETDDAYLISPGHSQFFNELLRIRGRRHPDDLTIEGEGDGSVLKVDESMSTGHTHQIFAIDIETGLDGLEIRDLRLSGTYDYPESKKESVVHGIRCGKAHRNAKDNIDILVEDVLCENVSGIAFKSNFGGVRFNRCTAIDAFWHGFETTAHEVVDSTDRIADPPIEITNSYALRCGLGGGGHYGHNSSGGKSITRNFVARNCFQGTKVTSPTISAEYQNVRFEDSQAAGFQRTGNSGMPDITWGNAVIENNGFRAITGRAANHTILEGSEIVATGNAKQSRWDVHFYQGATLDAEGATLYVNNSNAEVAFSWDSDNRGELGVYAAAQNASDDLYKNGNLTVHDQQETLKTDIEAVPTASEVGAWS